MITPELLSCCPLTLRGLSSTHHKIAGASKNHETLFRGTCRKGFGVHIGTPTCGHPNMNLPWETAQHPNFLRQASATSTVRCGESLGIIDYWWLAGSQGIESFRYIPYIYIYICSLESRDVFPTESLYKNFFYPLIALSKQRTRCDYHGLQFDGITWSKGLNSGFRV